MMPTSAVSDEAQKMIVWRMIADLCSDMNIIQGQWLHTSSSQDTTPISDEAVNRLLDAGTSGYALVHAIDALKSFQDRNRLSALATRRIIRFLMEVIKAQKDRNSVCRAVADLVWFPGARVALPLLFEILQGSSMCLANGWAKHNARDAISSIVLWDAELQGMIARVAAEDEAAFRSINELPGDI
jgi:hypothetical protein